MLWLGLCLPRLPLEVFQRTVDAGPEGPGERPAVRHVTRTASGHRLPAGPTLAVCDRLQVLHASDAAQACGVHPGMKRATALAILPDLVLVDRDPAREREALEQVAAWALQFTPSVSLQGDERMPGLLLEVEPSLRLFRGLDALTGRLRAGLEELGFSGRTGCAPTATGAWLLALHADGARAADPERLEAKLAGLPASLLESAAPHLDALASIGARTLGDLSRLPRAGLARRFGKALLAELDRARGLAPEPRRWFEAPAEFHARLELLAQVENAEALLFAARRLIAQLCGWLNARHGAVRAFELEAEHEDRAPSRFALRLADPSRDPERLGALLRERLQASRLPAPAHTLRLRCTDVQPLAAPNRDLFPVPASAAEELGRLVERLQARLGRDKVQRLLLAQDHRPESAYRVEPVERLAGGPAPELPAARLPRPLWLLDAPVPIAERNNRPYWRGPLTLLAGPERIEGGWWDCALVQRDYFIAEDESHALLWVYRERLPDAGSRHGWFVHGRFG